MWLVSGENNYCKQIQKKKSVILLILPKYMSSWYTINENEICIRKMEPFQSGGSGKGEKKRGVTLVSEIDDYAPPVEVVGRCLHLH